MKIIVSAIIKGGTGKTTTAAALTQAAAAAGKKVLAIDMDPQAHLTLKIGGDPARPGAYHLLHGADPAESIQQTQQGFDCIAASSDLAAETTAPGSGKRLLDAIKRIRARYDVIFIDTPPQMGELTFNAIWAATDVIIPMEPDDGSLEGFYQISDICQQIQTRARRPIRQAIVITRYDSRTKINRHMKDVIMEELTKETGIPVLAVIRNGTAIREAHGFRLDLYQYAPQSAPAQDYKQLFNRLMKGE